jgi:hypothetical protein
LFAHPLASCPCSTIAKRRGLNLVICRGEPFQVNSIYLNRISFFMMVLQLRKMLDLLVHASMCRSGSCQYPHCRKVKGLFRHGMQCKTRASGGCVLCKKMWYMLQLHARACKDSECKVPRCRFVHALHPISSSCVSAVYYSV